MRKVLGVLSGFAISLYAVACGASPCAVVPHPDWETVIEISGVLHKEVHWGPPHFGENPKTDSKFAAWILHVDVPFSVMKDSKTGARKETKVTDIQLELSSSFSNEKITALVGKHITVEGHLSKATTPGDVSDFNISVIEARIDDVIENLSCVNDQ